MTTETTMNRPLPSRRVAFVEELREIPVRHLVLAGALAFILAAGARATPLHAYPGLADTVGAFIAGLWGLGALLLVLAPVLALRWPMPATTVAALPMLLVAFGDHRWPFAAFASLVAVAMVGTWRSPRLAPVPLAVSLGYAAVLLSGHTTMVMPYGAEIFISYRTVLERLATFGMYVVGVALAYGAALWLRSSALAERTEEALSARASAVEDEAALVGERARLARDLHDVVAHHVSLIAVRAETAPYTHPDLPRRRSRSWPTSRGTPAPRSRSCAACWGSCAGPRTAARS